MSMQPDTKSSNPPLGAGRDLWRRLLFHHLPLAVSSTTVFVLWMTVPIFQSAGHHGPSQGMQHEMQADGHQGLHHDGGHHGPAMGAGGHHGGAPQATGSVPMDSLGRVATNRGEGQNHPSIGRGLTATGYIALGLIALTLLIGPANLLLGRRVPVSNYLSRDVGTWATVFSITHTVVIGRLAYVNDGGITGLLHFFVALDGSLLTSSFGLGNWTGLAALVVVGGLLAISNDLALRTLRAKLWKRIQRLNYVLFALVIAHAIFYGALLRIPSAATFVLLLAVIAVLTGQLVGIWLWRRKYGGIPAEATL